MKWIDRHCDAASGESSAARAAEAGVPYALSPADAIGRIAREVSRATGEAAPLKDVEIEAMGEAIRLALARRGETVAARSRVVELSAHLLAETGQEREARRWLVFGGESLRVERWTVAGDLPFWVLDLKRLTLNAGSQIELTLLPKVDAALSELAEVWDAQGGGGHLGLRHLGGVSACMAGDAGAAARRGRAMAARILEHCRDVLARISARRGWSRPPEVIVLESKE
jgi:hypothetical protein